MSHWSDFRGRVIPSTVQPGVRYELRTVLGKGGMGTAYLAMRHADAGAIPVVVKIINPTSDGEEGARAALAIQKEAVALGRLNEQVPPTPYVVRLVDTGSLEVTPYGRRVTIPWIAVEYVHGGLEGTTLEERVEHSVGHTGRSFSPERAARAVRCLASGIEAVHNVGVIHRDLKPANVLCSGFGLEEVLKIADFGIARPSGMAATYGSTSIGTPGYAAPEQAFPDHGPITTASDIFALGAITFFLLTGDMLFDAPTVVQTVLLSLNLERKSLLDCPKLSPELRAQPQACRAIDQAIARATAGAAAQRLPDAKSFATAVFSAMDEGPLSVRSSRAVSRVFDLQKPSRPPRWQWAALSLPGSGRVARRAAWTGDAQCLVPTNRGLEHWDGTRWRSADRASFTKQALLFARAIRPGSWLVGGTSGLLAVYTAGAEAQIIQPPEPVMDIIGADGDPADLMVCIASAPARGTFLHAMAAKRWVRPVEVPSDAVVNDIARIEDTKWLVCGRHRTGAGFAAVYEPLMWRIEALPGGDAALVACAGQMARGIGIAVGRAGAIVEVTPQGPRRNVMPQRSDCAAAALDVSGQAWAGTTGRILSRTPAGAWEVSWSGEWQAPFTSLHADVGIVHAMTVDGAIVEGRAVAEGHAS
jgi:serine/threonine protein kinase